MWGTPQKKAEATLKQALTQAPDLRLPDPEKTFQLYVHEREGIAFELTLPRLFPLFHGHKVGMLFFFFGSGNLKAGA